MENFDLAFDYCFKVKFDSVSALIVCRRLRTSIHVMANTIASRMTSETTHSITVKEMVPAEIQFS